MSSRKTPCTHGCEFDDGPERFARKGLAYPVFYWEENSQKKILILSRGRLQEGRGLTYKSKKDEQEAPRFNIRNWRPHFGKWSGTYESYGSVNVFLSHDSGGGGERLLQHGK